MYISGKSFPLLCVFQANFSINASCSLAIESSFSPSGRTNFLILLLYCRKSVSSFPGSGDCSGTNCRDWLGGEDAAVLWFSCCSSSEVDPSPGDRFRGDRSPSWALPLGVSVARTPPTSSPFAIEPRAEVSLELLLASEGRRPPPEDFVVEASPPWISSGV